MTSLEELLQIAEAASVGNSAAGSAPGDSGVQTPSTIPGAPTSSLEELLAKAQGTQTASLSGGMKVPGLVEGKDYSPNRWGPEADKARSKNSGAVQNFGAGAWDTLTKVLGYPADTIAMALNHVGGNIVNDKGELVRPGDAAELFKQALRTAGVNPDPDIERFSGRAGKNTFEGLVTTAAAFAAAPALGANLAAAGWTKLGNIVTELGKHPGLALLQEFGAGPGATAGRELYSDKSPAGQMAGGMLGAMTGAGVVGMATGAAKMGFNAVRKGVDMLPENIPGPLRPGIESMMPQPGTTAPMAMPTTPLRPATADPQAITQFAQARNYGDNLLLEEAINKAVESIPKAPLRSATGPNRGEPRAPNALAGEFEATVPYAQTQNNLSRKLEAAVEVAQGMENRAWNAIGQNQKVPGFDLQLGMQRVTRMPEWYNEQKAFLPEDLVESFNKMWAPRPGKTMAETPTIGQVKSWMDSVQLRIDTLGSRGTVNERMLNNLDKIKQVGVDRLQKAFPDDVRIQQALDISNRVRGLIHQGPVAQLRGRSGTGEMDVSPSLTTDTMLGTYGGVKSVMALEKELAAIPSVVGQRGAPGVVGSAGPVRPSLATNTEQQTLRDLTKSVEDSINAGFRDHAEKVGMDPAKIGKWLRDNEGSIKDITASATKFSKVYDVLEKAAASRKEISQSLFQRYLLGDTPGGVDPQAMVGKVFNSDNPRGVVTDIMNSRYVTGAPMRNDPGAMDGLRQTTIDYLVRRMNGDPTKIYDFATQSKNARALETIFGADDYNRIIKNASVAMRLQSGDIPQQGAWLTKAASLMASVVGSHLGKATAMMTGGGSSLIAQGAGAKAIRGWVTNRLEQADPKELFARALLSPKDEAILLRKVPETAKQMEALTKEMLNAVRLQESFRQQIMDEYRKPSTDVGRPLRFADSPISAGSEEIATAGAQVAESATASFKQGPGWEQWLNEGPFSSNVVDRSKDYKGSLRDYGSWLDSNPIAGRLNKLEGDLRKQEEKHGVRFKGVMK